MIWNAHRPITTTAAPVLLGVGGARKTQSVRFEWLGTGGSFRLVLVAIDPANGKRGGCYGNAPGNECVRNHLGARFQNCGAAWRLATVCKRLGFVAVDSVDGPQAIGGSFAVHVPVIAAHNVSSKPGGEPGVVAGLCEAAHSGPSLVGGGAQHRPVNVGAKFFARDGASSGALNGWASLGWYLSLSRRPLAKHWRWNACCLGKEGLTAPLREIVGKLHAAMLAVR